jgi:hypothetical protein
MDGSQLTAGVGAEGRGVVELEERIKELKEEIILNRAAINRHETRWANFDQLQQNMSAVAANRTADARSEITEEFSS